MRGVDMENMKRSLQSHKTSISSLETKLACESENNRTADLKAVDDIMLPFNVKIEPEPYCLSHELFSQESTICPDDHSVKLDLLVLKSEIKSELSTDEHLPFKDTEVIVDPLKHCVEPEIEQVNSCGLPERPSESLGLFQVDDLQHPTTQVKQDCGNTEVLVLTEPEGLNQDGRFCHFLRCRTQVNNRLVKQLRSKKVSCKSTKFDKAKTKLKDTNVSCSLCGNVFANSSSLGIHMQTHGRMEPHKDPICGKVLTFKSKVKIITGQKRSRQRFPCNQCDKTFAFSSGLRVHIRTHTGERPYHCDTCGKDFSRSDFLAMHMKHHERTRTGERPFECDQCGKKLTSRGFLQLHKERLHGQTKEDGQRERQFSCGSCGKAFMTKRCLRSHETTHTDWRPYACTLCGHSFRRKDSLTKHMRIHSNERPYSCDLCGKTFPYTHCLKSHLKIHKRTKK